MSTDIENLDLWVKIELSIRAVYPLFLQNLGARHGNLSPKEIKICMLLMLKRSPAEIASILEMREVHAVTEAMSRISHKFGLKRS